MMVGTVEMVVVAGMVAEVVARVVVVLSAVLLVGHCPG